MQPNSSVPVPINFVDFSFVAYFTRLLYSTTPKTSYYFVIHLMYLICESSDACIDPIASGPTSNAVHGLVLQLNF